MTALTQDDVLETALELCEQEAYADAYAFITTASRYETSLPA